MTDPALPTTAPDIAPEARPYWEAAAAGRLRLQRCRRCNEVIWYPRGLCPVCGATDLDWFEASGTGSIYSFTINRRGDGTFRSAAPYVLAYVELSEGPRVMTNLVGADPDSLEIGQPVQAVFDRCGDDVALVRFRPA